MLASSCKICNKAIKGTSMRQFRTGSLFDRQFWRIGLLVLSATTAVAAWQFQHELRQHRLAQARAEQEMRDSYPDLHWAFEEWKKCDQGTGDYAKHGYITREQCDLAVLAQARQRGSEERVRAALHVRESSR